MLLQGKDKEGRDHEHRRAWFRTYTARDKLEHPEKWKKRKLVYAKSRRIKYVKAKQDAKNVPCTDCGIKYPSYVMDFDHVRGEKQFNIGSYPLTTIPLAKEIEKCDVVCSNCHRERTHKRLMDKPQC